MTARTDLDVDLLILGGGPTGLYASHCAGFRGMTVALVDSLPQLGGQLAAMYPEKPIYDVAGFSSVRGKDLVAELVDQLSPFAPTLLLGETARDLEHLQDQARRFAVTTHLGTVIRCSSIVIAGGIGAVTPRPLPAGKDYEGRGVSYFVTEYEDFRDRHVLIVGGGDSAVDWCLLLEPIAASVALAHRREQFRAHQHTVDQVKASSVELIIPAQVTAIGGDGAVEWADITVTGTEVTHRRQVDRIIAAVGFTANLGPLKDWGIEIEGNRHVLVDSTMRTNIPGIYAAGDITQYRGKVRLISVGFGEAATAVNNAVHENDPENPVFPGHSTDHADTFSATPA